MRRYLQSFLLLIASVFVTAGLQAQNPVKWSFSAKDAGNCQVDLVLTGNIEDGWSTYSQFVNEDDGPLATLLTFSPGDHYKILGKAKESGGYKKAFDKVFGAEVAKFIHTAVITQRVEVSDPSKPITGYITYMACNDNMCLPPRDVDFKFTIPALNDCGGGTPAQPAVKNSGQTPTPTPGTTGAVNPAATGTVSETPGQEQTDGAGAVTQVQPIEGAAPPPVDDPNFKGYFLSKRPEINAAQFVGNCNAEVSGSSDGSSWVSIFLLCFLGGLIALLTPCVFPMIPMTVSF